jgi:hypothetical protein
MNYFIAYTFKSMVCSNNHHKYLMQTHKLITTPWTSNNKYKKHVICLKIPISCKIILTLEVPTEKYSIAM